MRYAGDSPNDGDFARRVKVFQTSTRPTTVDMGRRFGRVTLLPRITRDVLCDDTIVHTLWRHKVRPQRKSACGKINRPGTSSHTVINRSP